MLVHHTVTWFVYYEVTRSITYSPPPPLDGMLVHHRVTWLIYYEVTRSITNPPGWEILVHHKVPPPPPSNLSPVPVYTPGWRETT